jgi:hypothetical protein
VCRGVDCSLKYLGARNWYNLTAGLCQAAATCTSAQVTHPLLQRKWFKVCSARSPCAAVRVRVRWFRPLTVCGGACVRVRWCV